jgi:hypothetical protein
VIGVEVAAIELVGASASAVYVIKTAWRILARSERRIVLRLLLARPLWWLVARLLAVPDAHVRYTKFSVQVMAKWEDFLLDRRSEALSTRARCAAPGRPLGPYARRVCGGKRRRGAPTP